MAMDSRLVSDADAGRPELRRMIDGLRGTRRGRGALYVGSVALVAGAYYLAGRLGLELAYLDGAVAAVWPPAGVGLALLFLYGVRLWPGIVIGDLLLRISRRPSEPSWVRRSATRSPWWSPPCCCGS
jgi:hypothetical protein